MPALHLVFVGLHLGSVSEGYEKRVCISNSTYHVLHTFDLETSILLFLRFQ